MNYEPYVKKINELYITTRQKYLKVKPDQNIYKTVSKEIASEKGWIWRPLNDYHIEKHLKGDYSIGVFSGENTSKFLAIDVDLHNKKDKLKLKWIYNLIIEAFDYVGIDKDYLHVSYSGGGGIHVLLFTEAVSLNFFITLYHVLMKRIADNLDKSIVFDKQEYYLDIENVAKLEMRCTNGLGIRLDLGRNWKHTNKKSNKGKFLDRNNLEILPDNYLLSIEQMPKDEFFIVMDAIYDREEDIKFVNRENIEQDKKLIVDNIQENFSHKINRDENETISYIQGLLINGLPMSGTRNNSVFKICKYFLYMGMDEDKAEDEIIKWMSWQDKKKYSITIEEAIEECKRILKLVFEKGYRLLSQVEDLHIYKSEIEKIMTVQNRNDKLLIYTMLLHSKRFSTQDQIFYMTYKQMYEMCGISNKGARSSISRLEEMGLLEVVSRNIRRVDSYKHKPNRYRILLNVELSESVLTINNENNLISNNHYYESLIKTYNNIKLKELLPRRQYSDVIKYQKSNVS